MPKAEKPLKTLAKYMCVNDGQSAFYIFQTYEQRMSSLITHPLFDYKVSYRRALELQARLLAKTLTGEISEYIPLMTR